MLELRKCRYAHPLLIFARVFKQWVDQRTDVQLLLGARTSNHFFNVRARSYRVSPWQLVDTFSGTAAHIQARDDTSFVPLGIEIGDNFHVTKAYIRVLGKKILLSTKFPHKFFDTNVTAQQSMQQRKMQAVQARRQQTTADHVAVDEGDVNRSRRRRTAPPLVPRFHEPASSAAPPAETVATTENAAGGPHVSVRRLSACAERTCALLCGTLSFFRVHECVRACAHVCMHMCVRVRACVYARVCMCVLVCACVCLNVCLYMCVCACARRASMCMHSCMRM